MSGLDGTRDGSLSALELGDKKAFRSCDAPGDGALNNQQFSRVESMYQCSLSDHLRFFSTS